MSYWKLRDFLNKLQQPGELIRIQEPLSPHLEIPAVARYSTEACREAVVFDSIQRYPGFRMVTGSEAYSVDPRVPMKRPRLGSARGYPPARTIPPPQRKPAAPSTLRRGVDGR